MGANESSDSPSRESGAASSADPIADASSFILDAGKIATITWEQFLHHISRLNERCRKIMDENGKYLVFAIKKGSTDTFLWKATVRICCVKVNSATNKVESRKILTLSQFLRLQKSMESVIIPIMSQNQPETSSSLASASDSVQKMFTTSVILEKVTETELQQDCIICMERLPDIILPCSHCYCLPCIEQWKEGGHHSCPICRKQIEKGNDEWVISDFPEQEELRNYFMKLAD